MTGSRGGFASRGFPVALLCKGKLSRNPNSPGMKRREFLILSTAALAAPALAVGQKPLKILILGGTGFIGPHQVETALGRGHQVSIFNRGKTAPNMFPQVENLIGDRDNDLGALKGRKWDAVIDNSGYIPRWVRQSAVALKPNVGQYLYMSSLSVYADNSVIGLTEKGQRLKLEDPTTEERSPQTYGGMKALSEDHVKDSFPDNSTLIRAGLIVGPGDPTDRFTYWPVRMHRGGETLAPGTPKDPIQCIDVRDLARWTIQAIEDRHYGPYNVTGPYHQMTMGQFLDITVDTTNSTSTLTWIPWEFLKANNVSPWTDLPLWVPPNSGMDGFVQVDITRAVKADLTFRPMAQTVQDSLAWHRTIDDGPLKAGLTAEREAEILKKWHQSRVTD
jgi:2'-hydroxyisoflavone reductase